MLESIALGVLSALHQLNAMAVIGAFTLLLLALFGAALAAIGRGRGEEFYRGAPTLLTTLGILGTFLGIAIGLLEFDVRDIEYSIPVLLDGLKLAFVTSIIGILFGAILRLVLLLGTDNAETTQPTETGANAGQAQLAALERLIALGEHQTEGARAQLAATRALEQRLERLDTDLIQTLESHHAQLLGQLDDFARRLGEMGSRQLIEALEGAIRDFNDKLGVQFGENFRRLDDSVGKLLQWQEQYRQHMQVLGDQLDHAVGAVGQSQTALEALTHQAMQISRHVEDQETTMAGLRRETMELEALLSGIAELRDRAKEAFPAMDSRLKAMLENIENAVLSALEAQRRIAQATPTRGAALTAEARA
ncbi:hypothetical protein [Marichromatium bheemlicum]|uniref:MotA/TolQ/ExbB proton channel domain-containing protein n=1 Tax=Marichromatium bheemlicum TaxID=365339 RepID=A0ABX1I7F0_9GAMM|nr:hypothetical protein [Marichromatium bheemlicum]NKN33502.1 hypothetical protein [Marichromatium bheemlicum]